MESSYVSSILVTGAAGDIGAIGRNLTAMLLAIGPAGFISLSTRRRIVIGAVCHALGTKPPQAFGTFVLPPDQGAHLMPGGIVGASFDEFRWLRPVRPGDELRVESDVPEFDH